MQCLDSFSDELHRSEQFELFKFLLVKLTEAKIAAEKILDDENVSLFVIPINFYVTTICLIMH